MSAFKPKNIKNKNRNNNFFNDLEFDIAKKKEDFLATIPASARRYYDMVQNAMRDLSKHPIGTSCGFCMDSADYCVTITKTVEVGYDVYFGPNVHGRVKMMTRAAVIYFVE